MTTDGPAAPPLSSWTIGSRAEPTLRVAIVLPEDHMSALAILAPEPGYVIHVENRKIDLPPGQYELRAMDGRVILEGIDLPQADRLRIVVPSAAPLARGAGLKAFGIVAGRGFHWQRSIDVTFLGAFEFRALGSHLLVINELPLESYLAGVIAAEMSGDCPLEFLRSQCIVARSWVLAHTEDKHSDLGLDRCNDDCCQRYQGTHDITPTVIEAVRSTRGQVIVDERGGIIDANYSKSCGGIIEAPEHVWGSRKSGQRAEIDAPAGSAMRRFFPLREQQLDEFLTGDWLQNTDIFCSPAVVPDRDLPRYLGKVDDGGGHFRWSFRYARHELEEILQRKLFSRQATADPLGTLLNLHVVARGDSGRAKQLRIEYLDPAGRQRALDVHTEYNIRNVLHASFLYSSAFVVRLHGPEGSPPTHVELIGAGWGHGAGLCQIGALGMSLRKYGAEEILHHYFSPVRIHACY